MHPEFERSLRRVVRDDVSVAVVLAVHPGGLDRERDLALFSRRELSGEVAGSASAGRRDVMDDQLRCAFILYLERVAYLFALFDLAEVVFALLHRNLRSGGLGHCFWRAVLRRGLREGGEGKRDDQR